MNLNSISWNAQFIEYPDLSLKNGLSRNTNLLLKRSGSGYTTTVDILPKEGIFSKFIANDYSIFKMKTEMIADTSGKISFTTQGVLELVKSDLRINCPQQCELTMNKGEKLIISYLKTIPGVTLTIMTDIIPQKVKLASVSTSVLIASNQRKKVNFFIPVQYNTNDTSISILVLPKYGQLYYKSDPIELSQSYSLLQAQDIFYKSIKGIGYDTFNYKYSLNEESEPCKVNIVVYPLEIPDITVINGYFKVRENEEVIAPLSISFDGYSLMDPIPIQVPGPRFYYSIDSDNSIVYSKFENGIVTLKGIAIGTVTLPFEISYGSLDQSISANGKILVEVLRGSASAPIVAGGTIGAFVALILCSYIGYYTYHKFFAKKYEEKVNSHLCSGKKNY